MIESQLNALSHKRRIHNNSFVLFCFSIDATKDTTSLGRMVNDSPNDFANAKMKRVICETDAHLCLFAINEIKAGTEIRCVT